VKTKGTIYLSNIRMVFVANKPVGNFFAFDMPLVSSSIQKFGSLHLLTEKGRKKEEKTAMAPNQSCCQTMIWKLSTISIQVLLLFSVTCSFRH